MWDWTEERGRSVTSRHVEEREREERVMGLAAEEVPAVAEAVARVFRVERIVESGFRSFLNGRVSDSESESGSVWRRFFFLSAIERERVRESTNVRNGRYQKIEMSETVSLK